MKESPERIRVNHLIKDGVVGETLVSLQMTGFYGVERKQNKHYYISKSNDKCLLVKPKNNF